MNAKPVIARTQQTFRLSGPFADLHEGLTAEGLFPGVPLHLRIDTQAADQELCRRMRCPSCHLRGLAYRPYTDGKRSYRVLASCPSCNACEEV